MLTTISCSLAKCSCPSWNASIDESALRRALANLDDCSSSRHWWLEFWTFWVVFGVVMEVIFVVWEYVNERRDFRQGTIHTPERPNIVLFTLGLLGAGLVAAGVSGEFWEESRIATVETCIRKGNNTLFLLLSKEAGDAATSVRVAREETNALKKEANEFGNRLSSLKSKANALSAQLNAISPRALLIHDNEDKLLKTAQPFPGQAFAIEICGTFAKGPPFQGRPTIANKDDLEKSEAGDALRDVLHSRADWHWWFVHGLYWEKCRIGFGGPAWVGLFVFVNKNAPPKTADAAQTLGAELSAILPRQPKDMLVRVDPREASPDDPRSPFSLVVGSPDLIVILVGASPLANGINKQKTSTGTKP